MRVRSRGLNSKIKVDRTARLDVAGSCWSFAALAGSPISLFLVLLMLFTAARPLAGRGRDKMHYGEGLIVNIPLPESQVEQVVAGIAQNGMIRGTKEYNKDQFVGGAIPASTSSVFPPWDGGGKVFYKVRLQALDPRNFKDSSDVGTLAVRYVLQPQGKNNTVLRINALFEEEFRHTIHQSNGSVENAEYKDIQEHIEAIEVMKQQDAEAEKERQAELEKKRALAAGSYAPETSASESSSSLPTAAATQTAESQPNASLQTDATEIPSQPPSVQTPPVQSPPTQTLEERVKDLRRQVEGVIKAPGAPLKSAPFHTASTLHLLTEGTDVLIRVATPYWYGVETHDGQHGWIMREQLGQP